MPPSSSLSLVLVASFIALSAACVRPGVSASAPLEDLSLEVGAGAPVDLLIHVEFTLPRGGSEPFAMAGFDLDIMEATQEDALLRVQPDGNPEERLELPAQAGTTGSAGVFGRPSCFREMCAADLRLHLDVVGEGVVQVVLRGDAGGGVIVPTWRKARQEMEIEATVRVLR